METHSQTGGLGFGASQRDFRFGAGGNGANWQQMHSYMAFSGSCTGTKFSVPPCFTNGVISAVPRAPEHDLALGIIGVAQI